MLSRLENKVLISLLSVCKEKGAVLISPIDLLKIIGTEHLTLSKLEKTEDLLEESIDELQKKADEALENACALGYPVQ